MHGSPDFFLPFPETDAHPRADEVEAEAYAWAHQQGLVDTAGHQRLAASRVVSAGTGYYPEGTMADLAIVAHWYVWSLLVADHLDDAPPDGDAAGWDRRSGDLLANLSALFDGGKVLAGDQHGPLFTVVADDLWPRTAARRSAAWRCRFGAHLRECLAAYWWQGKVRNGALSRPAVADYLSRRRYSFGAYPFYDLIELVEGLDLPESFFIERTWHDLTAAASDVMAWTNDILSLPKDVAYGECANMVLLLHPEFDHQDEHTGQRWVAEVNQMVSERVRQFLYAQADLPYTIRTLGLDDAARAQADLLVTRLGAMMRASLDWHLRSARYQAAEVVFGDAGR